MPPIDPHARGPGSRPQKATARSAFRTERRPLRKCPAADTPARRFPGRARVGSTRTAAIKTAPQITATNSADPTLAAAPRPSPRQGLPRRPQPAPLPALARSLTRARPGRPSLPRPAPAPFARTWRLSAGRRSGALPGPTRAAAGPRGLHRLGSGPAPAPSLRDSQPAAPRGRATRPCPGLPCPPPPSRRAATSRSAALALPRRGAALLRAGLCSGLLAP